MFLSFYNFIECLLILLKFHLFPKYFLDLDIINLNLNTLYLVLLASIFIVLVSLFTNYGGRVSKSKILNYLTNFSVSGYAIPGVILAVAFITFFSNISDRLSENLDIKR